MEFSAPPLLPVSYIQLFSSTASSHTLSNIVPQNETPSITFL